MSKTKKRKSNRAGGNSGSGRTVYDYSNPQELKRYVASTFSSSIQDARSRMKSSPQTGGEYDIKWIDMDAVRGRRRQDAVLSTMDEVRRRVSPICPEVPDIFYIEEEWTIVNSLFVPGYDLIEDDECLLLGATLWILDRIRENGRLSELVDLLPKDMRQMGSVYLHSPYINDPGYGEEIILGVNYMLRNRNADCVGLKTDPPSEDPDEIVRVLMDDYTARKMQHQEVPSRRRFESLLSLIRPEDREAAAKHFEDKLWEWVDIYFSSTKIYTDRQVDVVEKKKRFNRKADRTLEELQAKIDALHSGTGSRTGTGSSSVIPFSSAARSRTDSLFSGSRASVEMEVQRSLAQLDAEKDQLNRELVDVSREKEQNALSMFEFADCTYEYVEQALGPDLARRITDFSIEDPYELCFGLLYLIDTDSDLPWLYYPGISLATNIGSRLPWHYGEYDPDCDTFWRKNTAEELADDDIIDDFHVNGEPRPKSPQPPEPIDWYKPEYTSTYKLDGYTSVERANLAQIVYEITGGVMPRNTHRYDDATVIFKRFGITGKKTLAPLYQCLNLLGESENQTNLQFYIKDKPETAKEDDAATEAEKEQKSLQELKRENDQLKQALHDMTREAKDARKRLEEQSRIQRAEKQELADLRELVYNQAQGAEESEAKEPDISLPYTVVHRTVVFGGHDSWLKAIRPLLPEVRFVAPGLTPNADLIRHADVVWIQPNALAHKDYYKLIDVVRKYDIPIHYFAYSGAEKCALQLAEEDQAMLDQ